MYDPIFVRACCLARDVTHSISSISYHALQVEVTLTHPATGEQRKRWNLLHVWSTPPHPSCLLVDLDLVWLA